MLMMEYDMYLFTLWLVKKKPNKNLLKKKIIIKKKKLLHVCLLFVLDLKYI